MACALRGVVNAREVRNSFVKGWLYSHACLEKRIRFKSQPKRIPKKVAARAWSFKIGGRIASLSGRTRDQNREGPTIIVDLARASIGPIVRRWGLG